MLPGLTGEQVQFQKETSGQIHIMEGPLPACGRIPQMPLQDFAQTQFKVENLCLPCLAIWGRANESWLSPFLASQFRRTS